MHSVTDKRTDGRQDDANSMYDRQKNESQAWTLNLSIEIRYDNGDVSLGSLLTRFLTLVYPQLGDIVQPNQRFRDIL